MYIKNRSGPRMEPCGTPHNTGRLGDVCESKSTNCVLFAKCMITLCTVDYTHTKYIYTIYKYKITFYI